MRSRVASREGSSRRPVAPPSSRPAAPTAVWVDQKKLMRLKELYPLAVRDEGDTGSSGSGSHSDEDTPRGWQSARRPHTTSTSAVRPPLSGRSVGRGKALCGHRIQVARPTSMEGPRRPATVPRPPLPGQQSRTVSLSQHEQALYDQMFAAMGVFQDQLELVLKRSLEGRGGDGSANTASLPSLNTSVALPSLGMTRKPSGAANLRAQQLYGGKPEAAAGPSDGSDAAQDLRSPPYDASVLSLPLGPSALGNTRSLTLSGGGGSIVEHPMTRRQSAAVQAMSLTSPTARSVAAVSSLGSSTKLSPRNGSFIHIPGLDALPPPVIRASETDPERVAREAAEAAEAIARRMREQDERDFDRVLELRSLRQVKRDTVLVAKEVIAAATAEKNKMKRRVSMRRMSRKGSMMKRTDSTRSSATTGSTGTPTTASTPTNGELGFNIAVTSGGGEDGSAPLSGRRTPQQPASRVPSRAVSPAISTGGRSLLTSTVTPATNVSPATSYITPRPPSTTPSMHSEASRALTDATAHLSPKAVDPAEAERLDRQARREKLRERITAQLGMVTEAVTHETDEFSAKHDMRAEHTSVIQAAARHHEVQRVSAASDEELPSIFAGVMGRSVASEMGPKLLEVEALKTKVKAAKDKVAAIRAKLLTIARGTRLDKDKLVAEYKIVAPKARAKVDTSASSVLTMMESMNTGLAATMSSRQSFSNRKSMSQKSVRKRFRNVAIQNTIEEELQLYQYSKMISLYRKEQAVRRAIHHMIVATANVVAFHENVEVDLTCRRCLNLLHNARILAPCGNTYCIECMGFPPEYAGELGETEAFLYCSECGYPHAEGYTPNSILMSAVSRWTARQSLGTDLNAALQQLLRTLTVEEGELRETLRRQEDVTMKSHAIVSAANVSALDM